VIEGTSGPHLSEDEIAALIYSAGQNRDAERRAYAHLATCGDCTRLVGSLRDSDRDTRRLLASLDVQPPTVTAGSIIRAAQSRQRRTAFSGRRAAAVVGFLVVAGGAAAAALPASPVHRWLAGLAWGGGVNVTVRTGRKALDSARAAQAVSFISEPGSTLELAFSSGSIGSIVDVQVVDADQVLLSSATPGAAYRVSSNRVAVDQSAPARFQLQVPRLLGELRVRLGSDVVFDRGAPVASAGDAFTIQLTRPNASR
jgi:hypothetical protein